MKTPDEIKKGLEACGTLDGDCENCPYDDGKQLTCAERLRRGALEYIQRLEEVIECSTQIVRAANELSQKRMSEMESRLAQVERERDAAVHDLHVLFSEDGHTCMICDVEKAEAGCMFDCEHQRKWRGVCEENTKEDEESV